MIRFLIPQLIVFLFCTLSAAQTPEQSAHPCPVISVQAPGGIIEPGALVKFTATISGGDTERVRYAWSISKGKIVSGQGTKSINMVYSG